MLNDKSISDLRGMAFNLGIHGINSMNRTELVQAIEQKQAAFAPPPVIEPPVVVVVQPHNGDANQESEIRAALEPYIKRGLNLTFPDGDTWAMTYQKKADTGTMTMPLRDVLRCADRLVRAK